MKAQPGKSTESRLELIAKRSVLTGSNGTRSVRCQMGLATGGYHVAVVS